MDIRNPALPFAILKRKDVDSQEWAKNMKMSCGQGSLDFAVKLICSISYWSNSPCLFLALYAML